MKTEHNNKLVHSRWFVFAQDDLRIVTSLWRKKEKINRGI